MSRNRESLKGKGAQIFLGSEEEQQARKPENSKTRIPENQYSGIPESQPLNLATSDKEKATYYLPVSVVDELEWMWMEARRATRKKVSKSDIVAIALHEVAQSVRRWKAGEADRCSLIERFSG